MRRFLTAACLAAILAVSGTASASTNARFAPHRPALTWTRTVIHLDWRTATRVTAIQRHVYVIRHPTGKVTGMWTRTVQRSPHVRVRTTYPRYAAPTPAGQWLTVFVSGYDNLGLTATGTEAGPGQVAVDPSVFPYGSRFYLPGYGQLVATDTGAFSGLHLDVWLPTAAACYAITGYRRVFVFSR